MSAILSELESRAMELSEQERAVLADRLLASLHDDPGHDAAWGEEVDRRLAAVESGEESLSTVEDALKRIRQSLA